MLQIQLLAVVYIMLEAVVGQEIIEFIQQVVLVVLAEEEQVRVLMEEQQHQERLILEAVVGVHLILFLVLLHQGLVDLES